MGDRQPNLLLIYADQHRSDVIGNFAGGCQPEWDTFPRRLLTGGIQVLAVQVGVHLPALLLDGDAPRAVPSSRRASRCRQDRAGRTEFAHCDATAPS